MKINIRILNTGITKITNNYCDFLVFTVSNNFVKLYLENNNKKNVIDK